MCFESSARLGRDHFRTQRPRAGNHYKDKDLSKRLHLFFAKKTRLCPSVWKVAVYFLVIMFMTKSASALVGQGIVIRRVSWTITGGQQHGRRIIQTSSAKAMNECTMFQTRMVPVLRSHVFRIPSHRMPVITSKSQLSAIPSPQPCTPTEEAAQQPEYYDLIFDLQLPEGRCIGLKLKDDLSLQDALTLQAVQEQQHLSSDDNRTTNNPASVSTNQRSRHWIYQKLHPDEIKFGLSLSAQAPSFWMGRLALRYALASTMRIESNDATSLPAILKDSYGRPQVPKGFMGSISHKGTAGVALVAQNDMDDRSSIGVDLESAQPRKVDIASKVLTPQEMKNLGRIPGVSRDEEVLLRFSLKESLYKALHPLVCQFVGFQEGQVEPAADGTARVALQLNSKAHENVQNVTAHWRRVGPYFLSTCSLQLRPGCQRIEK